MATSQKILKLDVSAEQSFVYLKCKQYDSNSRIYQLIITDRNIPVPLAGNEYVIASMNKPNNTYADTVCEWKSGKLYLTMTDDMLSVAGDGTLEIRIFNADSTEIISTMIVHINVQRSTLPFDRMIASDEFNVLNNLILSVLNAADTVAELNQLIKTVKGNIASYQADYNKLSTEARALISELTALLANAKTEEAQRIANELQRIANENARNTAEQKRETDTANAIQNLTNSVNTAIADMKKETGSAIDDVKSAISNMETRTDAVLAEMNNAKDDAITATNNTVTAINNANKTIDNANTAINNINQTNQDISDAEAIRVSNENQRIQNEKDRQTQETARKQRISDTINAVNQTKETLVKDVDTAIQKMDTSVAASIEDINEAKEAAINTTNTANDIAADLTEKRDSGYFKGDPGEDGKDGVVVDIGANNYTFEIEGEYLYLIYTDGTTPPDFSIDDDGYLVINIEE